MDLGISGKVALIGGGSKGLGKACAFRLAQEGVHVAICARDTESLKKTTNEIRDKSDVDVLPIIADLSNITNIENGIVKKIMEKFNRIDILFVNSGGPKLGSFFSLTEDDWRNSFDSVLYYVIELYRLVIPIMQKQQWGRIINSTSLSVKEPAEALILSNVFRTGVVSLAKTISRGLIKDNITINNVCPGAFKTDRAIEIMQERSLRTGESLEEIEMDVVKNLPLGRYQVPEEYGDLIAYLASESARGITGTTIQIDGGKSKVLF